MARRRSYRGGRRYDPGPRINEQIRISPVRLIDENEAQVGVVDLKEAKDRAREAGLDLVEIAADVRPPVLRIMDYGKYKYEQSKKEKANKQKARGSELKEVRLGRSMKIDPHDVEIRMKKAREFLMDGDKVQIVQNFRGREMQHKERGRDRMEKIIQQLSDISKVEVPPRFMGRRMTMILGPDKAKIEHLKRKQDQPADKQPPSADAEDDDAEASVESKDNAPGEEQATTNSNPTTQSGSSDSSDRESNEKKATKKASSNEGEQAENAETPEEETVTVRE